MGSVLDSSEVRRVGDERRRRRRRRMIWYDIDLRFSDRYRVFVVCKPHGVRSPGNYLLFNCWLTDRAGNSLPELRSHRVSQESSSEDFLCFCRSDVRGEAGLVLDRAKQNRKEEKAKKITQKGKATKKGPTEGGQTEYSEN